MSTCPETEKPGRTKWQKDNPERWGSLIHDQGTDGPGKSHPQHITDFQKDSIILMLSTSASSNSTKSDILITKRTITYPSDTYKITIRKDKPEKKHHEIMPENKRRSIQSETFRRLSWNVPAFSGKCQGIFRHKSSVFSRSVSSPTPSTSLLNGGHILDLLRIRL